MKYYLYDVILKEYTGFGLKYMHSVRISSNRDVHNPRTERIQVNEYNKKMMKANLKRKHAEKLSSKAEKTKSGHWQKTNKATLKKGHIQRRCQAKLKEQSQGTDGIRFTKNSSRTKEKRLGPYFPWSRHLFMCATTRQDDDEPTPTERR